MSDSIHVPGQTVKRIKALAKLFVPVVTIAAATAWTTTATWIRTRTSTDEVTKMTADCTTIAKEAQDQTKTQHVQIFALQQTALTMADTLIELHAQAEVERAYSGSKRLPEYIDRARKFYKAEFERQQADHPNDIVRALTLARVAVWRPDRD
jgi:Zn-dependent metalloprotease